MIKTITAIAIIIALQGCTSQSQALPNKYIAYECIGNKLFRVTPKSEEALRDTEGNTLDCNYTVLF